MPERIPGVSRTALWQAWKNVRRRLASSSLRDVVDFLEFDINPDKWIRNLLADIASNQYLPYPPTRFTIAKSRGFARSMTLPSIPDLVLYRALVDHLYQRAKRREHKHVYFERSQLHNVSTAAAAAAAAVPAPYPVTATNSYLGWKQYVQYRKQLIFKKVYPFLVTTDISNFFDSTLHSRVAESLYGLSVHPRLVSLLCLLLEALAIPRDYGFSQGIGLPVDEFDCSRKLAHILLFPHDDRMVALLGEDAYVRWMDDQDIGVTSRADGLRALAALGSSLARLHLTPNSSKSRILTLSEAKRHFHLDLNIALDSVEQLPRRSTRERSRMASRLRSVWTRAMIYEHQGHWDKILSRFYRLAGLAGARWLRPRAHKDILALPTLARRIADYMRCSGTVPEYLAFTAKVQTHPEQIYPDTNAVLIESLLRLEPSRSETRLLSRAASLLLGSRFVTVGAPECARIAPLLLLRFGGRRSLRTLRTRFDSASALTAPGVIRASAVVYASYGISEFRTVRRAAARLLRSPLAEMVRLIEQILEYREVPLRYKNRMKIHYDSVANRHYIDMRELLAVRLLALNSRFKVQSWIKQEKSNLLLKHLSAYDRQILTSLLPGDGAGNVFWDPED